MNIGFDHWIDSAFGAIIVGGIGYGLRFLTERSHAREMADLRKKHEEELREFTHRFNLLESRAQVTFSALHLERAQVIKHIYQEASNVGIGLQTILVMSINGFKQEEINEESDALRKRGSDLVDYITINRIFFTDEQEKLLQTLIDDQGAAVLKLTGPFDPNDQQLEGFNEIIR